MRWMTVACALLGVPSVAAAQQVTLQLDPAKAELLGLDAATVEVDVDQAIRDELGLEDADTYTRYMADAAAMSMRGLGVDYASNPKKFTLGAGFGTAVAGVSPRLVRGEELLPPGGYAVQLSAMGGVNLGLLTASDKRGPLDHVMVYAHGMTLTAPPNATVQGRMVNYGGHIQIKVGGPINIKAVEWGGVDLTSGYERGSYTLGLSGAVPVERAVDDDLTVRWKANGDFAITTSSATVPIEVSTNVRVLVFTAYAGAAVDLAMGQGDAEGSVSGPVLLDVDDQTERIGTATVSAVGRAAVTPQVGRAFLGVQINVLPVKLYGHINGGSNGGFGGHLGARLAL